MSIYDDPDLQREANQRSAAVRGARSKLIRQIRSGEMPLHRVMADRPAELYTMTLADLALLAPLFGPHKLEHLGREAVRAGVNLLVPLGRASLESRTWVGFRVRRRAPKPPAVFEWVDAAPMQAWLREVVEREGSFEAAARLLRVKPEWVRSHAKGQARRVRADVLEAATARVDVRFAA